jgi:crotonobetainyl-CoA:carnitine CoA-transferase CaiB-like acyl-CoA transferase
VLLEGFRPGVLDRLGFGYEAVAKREPRILYLSVSGFGQRGPFAERPAMDPVLQAFTGLMIDNKGEDGIPHRVPFVVIDMSTALYAYQALSTALYARRDEPRGRRIEVSLLEAAANIQTIRTMMLYLEGEKVKRAMPSGVFKTADGWLQFLVVRDQQWIAFCGVLGRPELAGDARFAKAEARTDNEAELLAIVRPAIQAKPTDHWAERLRGADIMHERLNTFRELLPQPQAEAIDLFHWHTLPGGVAERVPLPNIPGVARLAPGTPRGVSPVPGQHTRDILAEHGFGQADIAVLVERNIIFQATA